MATRFEVVLYGTDPVALRAAGEVPDALAGEIACAVIRLRPAVAPPTLPELTTYLLGLGLSKRKLPERLAIVDDFPRAPSGKIIKRKLRDGLAKSAPRAS